MKNTILSEINRVREIMGIINEQKVKTVVGKEIVEGPMTQVLNQLVREKESKLLKNWKFYITSSDKTIFLQLANKEIQSSSKKRRFIKNPTTGRQEISLNNNSIVIPVSIGGEGLFEELNKYKEFNHFFNTNTEAADILKKQIQNLKLNIEVYSVGGAGKIEIFVDKNKRKNRKKYEPNVFSMDDGVPTSILLPLTSKDEGSGTNSAAIVVNKDVLVSITSGGIASYLPSLTLRAPVIETEPNYEPEEPPEVFARDIVFKLQVTDPFEFDSPDITENAKNEIKAGLDRLVEDLNDENVYEQYINTKIKGKDIIVNAYSSIDAKSDEVGGGGVSDCSPGGTTTRAQYNLCLSQKRAETIVNYLKSEFPEIFGEANLIAKGMGELESPNSVNEPYYIKATAEHIKKYPELKLRLGQRFRNPPQKKHSDENRKSTAADRKFVINMPEFTTTKFD
tara:strand:+ start:6072 stop:7424 length:1353 start_codon:yes stop_codon:yes gene_type:complete